MTQPIQPGETYFGRIAREAQERMAAWNPDRRAAVQLQGRLHYERCVPESVERPEEVMA